VGREAIENQHVAGRQPHRFSRGDRQLFFRDEETHVIVFSISTARAIRGFAAGVPPG
jgi:hypothetical protein